MSRTHHLPALYGMLFGLAIGLGTPGVAAISGAFDQTGPSTGQPDAAPAVRMAQKKVFKYEVPKAPRVAPAPSAPSVTTRSAPSTTFTPRTTAPTTRSFPSTGGGGGSGGTIQIGPFGLQLGGGGGGGSCEGCRDSCYNSFHGTKKFTPCMRNCWNRYCRR